MARLRNSAAAGTSTYPTPYEQGGITGGTTMPKGATPGPGGTSTDPSMPPPPPPEPPIFSPPSPESPKFRVQPVDAGKWADPNKHDGKYDFLKSAQYYDPNKGFTNESIAQLNQLGYADWYGSGDKGGYRNVTDKGRAAGLEAGGFSGDFVQDFGGPNAQWAWDWHDPNAGANPGPAGGGGGTNLGGDAHVYPTGGPGGPGGGGTGGGGAPGFTNDSLKQALMGLFPNGAFNQGVVNSRVSNASDALNRNRKSQLATTQSALALRGQGTNDGTYGSAAGNLETRLGEGFNSSVNDIYANESQNADSRMIQALTLATGLTEEEAKNMVDMAGIASGERVGMANVGLGYTNAGINRERNQNDFTLGKGGLALTNSKNSNDYNIGLGRLGLDRDTTRQTFEHMSTDEQIRLLEAWLNGSNQSSNGHI